ncbi:hypothetical protein CXIVA_07880 [Clostridium sp. SY8519]|uniref:hypothetical protein n=1 Tax=Clostridium sp. (strain SY8519) TaxID=1042156 RepID=UPI0002172030|nr:hypothetical protein [Clostridium sp. SY8519]BAK46755.1 hypothetical protein CXIVA_07880 [Clostridium sp. SY8519]
MLIDLQNYPLNLVFHRLLEDKTTKQNIVYATDSYLSLGEQYAADRCMDAKDIFGLDPINVQPRILKEDAEQADRTRKKAEVFTPAWLCNKMNNFTDEEWFGRKDVFNIEKDHDWVVVEDPVRFPDKPSKSWKHYVDSRRLEITCGEAPYIVSRYDASTGELILPPKRRIGMLDRKLRIVNENTTNEKDWLKWTYRAFESVYGYEYQGDNLLLARCNLVLTFSDYIRVRLGRDATKKELEKVSNIIAWNFWQMDGLTDTVPYAGKRQENHQYTISDLLNPVEEETTSVYCRITNWRSKNSLVFHELKED